ncbi:hypothetical protein [Proteus phage M4H10_20]|nr:hypothetical protein [Proteus phage M4H10_20]
MKHKQAYLCECGALSDTQDKCPDCGNDDLSDISVYLKFTFFDADSCNSLEVYIDTNMCLEDWNNLSDTDKIQHVVECKEQLLIRSEVIAVDNDGNDMFEV